MYENHTAYGIRERNTSKWYEVKNKEKFVKKINETMKKKIMKNRLSSLFSVTFLKIIHRLILKTNDYNGDNGHKIQKQIHIRIQWFLMSNDIFIFVCFAIRYSLLCVSRLWFYYCLCSVLQLSFFSSSSILKLIKKKKQ